MAEALEVAVATSHQTSPAKPSSVRGLSTCYEPLHVSELVGSVLVVKDKKPTITPRFPTISTQFSVVREASRFASGMPSAAAISSYNRKALDSEFACI